MKWLISSNNPNNPDSIRTHAKSNLSPSEVGKVQNSTNMETMHSSPFPSPFPRLFHTSVPPQIEQPQRLGFWFHHKVCRFFFLKWALPKHLKNLKLRITCFNKRIYGFFVSKKKESPFPFFPRLKNLKPWTSFSIIFVIWGKKPKGS